MSTAISATVLGIGKEPGPCAVMAPDEHRTVELAIELLAGRLRKEEAAVTCSAADALASLCGVGLQADWIAPAPVRASHRAQDHLFEQRLVGHAHEPAQTAIGIGRARVHEQPAHCWRTVQGFGNVEPLLE